MHSEIKHILSNYGVFDAEQMMVTLMVIGNCIGDLALPAGMNVVYPDPNPSHVTEGNHCESPIG